VEKERGGRLARVAAVAYIGSQSLHQVAVVFVVITVQGPEQAPVILCRLGIGGKGVEQGA
jgi:hypothetical protein